MLAAVEAAGWPQVQRRCLHARFPPRPHQPNPPHPNPTQPGQVCEDCPNVKWERQPDPLTVSVEPGMPDRHTITFFEEGEPILDGT